VRGAADRPGQFAHYLDDPYVEPERTDQYIEVRCTTRSTSPSSAPSSAAASAGCWSGPGCARPASRPAHHREGRRLRRHLVLEPLPRRGVRRRVVHLPAAARRGRLHAEGEVLAGAPRSSSTAARSAATSTSTATPASRPRSPSCVGTTATPLGDQHQPRRPMRARFVVMANGPLHRPKLPGIPGIESFRATRSTPAAGTTTTPAATRRADSPAWPTSGSASSAPVPPPCSACPTWARGEGALRLPAHAVVDRRARQPAHRPRVGVVARAGLAASAGWTTSTTSCRVASNRGPGERRLDRHHRQAADHDAQGCDRRRYRPGRGGRADGADFEKMESIRAGSTRSSTTRTPPRR
jgi:hypothetical protein